jgi:MFS transporter, FLVCR family, feline leukemia virus subgroup C receptor-related protein
MLLVIIFYPLSFTVFQRAPPTPPSASAALAEQPKPNQSSPFLHSIKNLCFNINYVLLLITYGMNGK